MIIFPKHPEKSPKTTSRKISWTDLKTTSKKLILDPQMTHLHDFEYKGNPENNALQTDRQTSSPEFIGSSGNARDPERWKNTLFFRNAPFKQLKIR